MTKSKKIYLYTLFWSVALLLGAILADLYTNEGTLIFTNLYYIIITPSKLVTDYFNIGSLSSTFLNAALCGLAVNLLIIIFKVKTDNVTVAGYFLVIAHCFYGLNIFNMWLPMFGIMIAGLIKKEKLSRIFNLSLFATSLAPFISDFFFRYNMQDTYVFGEVQLNYLGIVLSIIFSLVAGFAIPALIPETSKMVKGYNLYKAGLAIGLFGFFARSLFYDAFKINIPDAVTRVNELYDSVDRSYAFFVTLFYAFVFLTTLFIGYLINNKSLKGYKEILLCDGWNDDFIEVSGFGATLINVGIYGIALVILYNMITGTSEALGFNGSRFTGPTTGAIIAAITFSMSGQTIRNTWGVAVGYTIFFTCVFIISKIFNLDQYQNFSMQLYLSSFAFSTGLCPFHGRYGYKVGICVGILDAIICVSASSFHAGFVLYNGGFVAGLTALLTIPILEFYNIKPKYSDNHLINEQN